MSAFLAAVRFLTVFPVPARSQAPDTAGRSISYFPLVGLVIGMVLAGLDWLLRPVTPPALTAALLIVALVILTGGLHMDGFLDTCDGLAGYRTAEERRRIMRDSRVGAFGAIGAVLLLLVKYAALLSIPARWLAPALVLMPVLSRWSMAYAIRAYPNARPEGLGAAFKQGASRERVWLATALLLLIAAGAAGLTSLGWLAVAALIVLVWLGSNIFALWMKSKFAGLTGDSYGAINEVSEVVVLMAVAVLAHNRWLLL